jgi:Flp pilus assembly protein TadD
VLAAGERRSAGARAQLLALAGDRGNAGIQRASALERVDRIANDRELAALRTLLHDADPLVRRSAVDAYENVPLEYREDLFEALRDAVRDVRLGAVPLLSPISIDALSPEQQASRERAKQEYVASQRINADRPEAHLNLGVIAASSGENAVAERELRAALEIDPQFVPAAVNLADLYRSSSKEADAERVLREALAASPSAGALHHALGLLLVRTGRTDEALASFERATTLEPGAVRYAYVYAVALADTGRRRDSIALLARTLAAHPNDRDVLAALATYSRESGDRQRAVEYADRLVTLEPDDPGVAQLRASLDG